MKQQLAIGLIGCGTIGKVHAASIAKAANCAVVAACDIDPLAVGAAITAYTAAGGNRTDIVTETTAYSEMLSNPAVDAVTIGLPNHLHREVTVAALNAGKHVFCEKPIATSYEDAVAMADAAKKNDRRLIIGVVNRFGDSVNQIKTIVGSGRIGRVYQINIKFKSYRSIPGLGGWFTDKARAGGGVMIDWGIHFVDLVFYIMNNPTVISVSGKGFSELAKVPRSYRFLDMWAGPPDYDGVCDVEEYVSGVIRTNGPFINFEGAWAQNINERAMYVDFLGTEGGIRFDYGGGFTIYGQNDDFLFETKPVKKDSDFYVNEFRGFAETALTGADNRADIGLILPVQKVLDLFYRSSELNREIYS